MYTLASYTITMLELIKKSTVQKFLRLSITRAKHGSIIYIIFRMEIVLSVYLLAFPGMIPVIPNGSFSDISRNLSSTSGTGIGKRCPSFSVTSRERGGGGTIRQSKGTQNDQIKKKHSLSVGVGANWNR